MRKIVLASRSPRRRELLKMLDIPFEVCESDFDESKITTKDPILLVKLLSENKAKNVSKKYRDALIIGADTIVVLKKEIMGKAKNRDEAFQMLRKLSGESHFVVSGFTIIDSKNGKTITRVRKTKVFFKKITDSEINNYLDTNEYLDKAAAYAIQGKGSVFVKKINGDYFNVVGLSIIELVSALKKFKIKIL